MLVASAGLARRRRRRFGHRWSNRRVSGLRLRRGASLSGRLLGGCSGGGRPAALFAARLPSGAVELPLYFASSAAAGAAAAFVLESSFLDARVVSL